MLITVPAEEQHQQQQQQLQPQQVYPEPKALPSWKQDAAPNPKHEQEKMAHELKEHSKTQQEITKTTHEDNVKSIKIEKHVVRNQHERDMIYSVAEKYKMEEETLDGIAETPGGAILSLTLGSSQYNKI